MLKSRFKKIQKRVFAAFAAFAVLLISVVNTFSAIPAFAYYDDNDIYELGNGHWGMLESTFRQSPIINDSYYTDNGVLLSDRLQALLDYATNDDYHNFMFEIDFQTVRLHLTMFEPNMGGGGTYLDWYYEIGEAYLSSETIDNYNTFFCMVKKIGAGYGNEYLISINSPPETVLKYYFPPHYWEESAQIAIETTILDGLQDETGIGWLDPRYFVGCSFVVSNDTYGWEERICFNFSTSAWRTYKSGYDDGYGKGTENMQEFGQEKYNDGLTEGYIEGYDVGYSEGLTEGQTSNLVGVSWLFAVLHGMVNALDFEILPNLKLVHLLALPIVFMAILLILKLVK